MNKVLRSYQDFSQPFDGEEEKLCDPAYLRVCEEVRDVTLRVTKCLEEFNSCDEMASVRSKSSKNSVASRKSDVSRVSTNTIDEVIENKAKLAELKAKAEYFEKEKRAELELDRTRLEKELAIEQVADRIHQQYLREDYTLSSIRQSNSEAKCLFLRDYSDKQRFVKTSNNKYKGFRIIEIFIIHI